MSASDKNLHFHCMHCGSHQEAVWKKPNLFTSARWVAEKCSICHKENDLTKVEVVSCPHCKETVLKNDPVCVCCGKFFRRFGRSFSWIGSAGSGRCFRVCGGHCDYFNFILFYFGIWRTGSKTSGYEESRTFGTWSIRPD